MAKSLYHLFYGGNQFGQIKPELWKEEDFKISLKDSNTIKVIYPDGGTYEIPLITEYNKAYIVKLDYDDNNIEINKTEIKNFDLTSL